MPLAGGWPASNVSSLWKSFRSLSSSRPTLQSVADRSYPLSRSVFVYINKQPGKALGTKEREFLRFVLSREGQEAVVRNGNYLPLTRAVVDAERSKLDAR